MADSLEFKTFERCAFTQCKLLKKEGSVHCPRHYALVDAYGLKKAEGLELGYYCEVCGKRDADDEPEQCRSCDTPEVCWSCREAGRCCKMAAAELEEEEEEAEQEVQQARRRLEALRSKQREAAHA